MYYPELSRGNVGSQTAHCGATSLREILASHDRDDENCRLLG
jgi:hypothetical protein